MFFRSFVVCCLAICWSLPVAFSADDRPNIIVIMCDDLGAEGLSCYGSQTYQTPQLDALAKSGVRFTTAFSQPICTPSRVKLMTGRANWRNYVRFGLLDPKEVTFGNLLQDAGYETVIAGKWQLSGGPEQVRNFGFDRQLLWQVIGRGSRYWNPVLHKEGELMTGLENSFGPDVVNQYLVDFIGEEREQPFFIYYPMCLPHWPFVPTPDSGPGGSRERIGKYDGQKGGTEYFDDMVHYIDKLVGNIVAKLESEGLRENTFILFTCDNGTATNITSRTDERTINGGKSFLSENGIHVPFICSMPKMIEAGRTSDRVTDFADVLPTLLDLAGVRRPERLVLDGESFLHELRGTTGISPGYSVIHYSRNGVPKDPGTEAKRLKLIEKQQKEMQQKKLGRIARDEQWKLYADGRVYDIRDDPAEKSPLDPRSLSESAKSRLDFLQGKLDELPPWTFYTPHNAKKSTQPKARQASDE